MYLNFYYIYSGCLTRSVVKKKPTMGFIQAQLYSKHIKTKMMEKTMAVGPNNPLKILPKKY